MEPMGTTARLHTVEEVMERLRVGRSTAFGLIASRQLRSVKVGRRRLVSEAALVEFIENLDRQTSSPEVFGQGRRADAQ
jgi:excisionase family DNA binding protein